MWVVKTHGETFYVNHVDATISWSTKETPNNPSTKGSLKFKECLLTINDDNEATISALTIIDKFRIRNKKLGITRIITQYGNQLNNILKNNDIKHGPIKTIGGACSTTFYVTDILDKSHVTLLTLIMGQNVRVLTENEIYYKQYDDPKYNDFIDIDDLYDDDE